MKLLVVFLGLCVAFAAAELCRDASDCDHETCTGDWVQACHSFTCTCDHNTHTGGVCATQSDCHGRCQDGNDNHQHCFDGHCRCLNQD